MIPTPFTNIAISLSGGGYRATAFHLGALSFLDSIELDQKKLAEEDKLLDRTTLLENVKIMSTISGGTLTGIMYALELAKEGNFKSCYKKLYNHLKNDDLVGQALEKLNDPDSWKSKYKNRNLINAFSEVYNDQFYKGATFADLYKDKSSHLTDVIFGSSEFTNALQFRFQESGSGRFGSTLVLPKKKVTPHIRLADAAASSSCFPGGFEPMVMPKDFSNGPGSPVSDAWKEKNEAWKKRNEGWEEMDEFEQYASTAIMDGGIIDNQGIEGVRKAEDRHSGKEGPPFIGTYIVSDVSSGKMKRYKVPEFYAAQELNNSPLKNFFSLNTINFIAVLLLALVSAVFYFCPSAWGIGVASSILTIVLAWFILFFAILSVFQNKISETFAADQRPELLKNAKVLLRTPVHILAHLIKFRATSVSKMVTDIFMRRIRTLQMEALHSNPHWNYRMVRNDIYTLEKEEDLPEVMKEVIAAANKMPTTLWFTEKESKDQNALKNLIACGQLTLCYNLREYCKSIKSVEFEGRKIWDDIPKAQQGQIDKLEDIIVESWKKFKLEPMWLVEEYNSDGNRIQLFEK